MTHALVRLSLHIAPRAGAAASQSYPTALSLQTVPAGTGGAQA